jgi:hypothetical protein
MEKILYPWDRINNQGILNGKYHCTIGLPFDWFGISCMTIDNFCFYLQNRLIQTSQTGGQWYNPLVLSVATLCNLCNFQMNKFCEPSPSETTVYFQSDYYNDTISLEHRNIYMNQQQVRTLWGVRGEGEREKENSRLTE